MDEPVIAGRGRGGGRGRVRGCGAGGLVGDGADGLAGGVAGTRSRIS